MKSTAYGWLMLAGILISVLWWSRMAKRDERLLIIYFAALFSAFLGAKVVYFAAEGWMFWDDPQRWIIWATGKTILGALLGGYVGVELAKKILGYTLATGDWFALIAPFGIALGRVGCLIHGCCVGRKCYPAWYTIRDSHGMARWPSVPVEIGFNIAAIFVFLGLRRWRLFPGQHFHLYLIGYGLFRFFHEFLRATPRLTGNYSGYQIAALAVAALGIVGFVRRRNAPNVTQNVPAVSSLS
jgi:phosphatidylglycerol:prolipoprotein diacylglycerol transferase